MDNEMDKIAQRVAGRVPPSAISKPQPQMAMRGIETGREFAAVKTPGKPAVEVGKEYVKPFEGVPAKPEGNMPQRMNATPKTPQAPEAKRFGQVAGGAKMDAQAKGGAIRRALGRM